MPRRRGPRFIGYFRVSTARQGASGLGLEAQRDAVRRYVAAVQGVIVANFTEIESGRKNDRPQIAAALAACRARKATLIIAKLDRLARNVAFISNLMESGVDFIAVDNPHATKLTIHVLAAIAEYEREAISQRIKDALAVVKARGVKLGNPRLEEARRRALEARRARPPGPGPELVAVIVGLARQGLSQREIARRLNALGLHSPRGRRWWGASIGQVLAAAQRDQTARQEKWV